VGASLLRAKSSGRASSRQLVRPLSRPLRDFLAAKQDGWLDLIPAAALILLDNPSRRSCFFIRLIYICRMVSVFSHPVYSFLAFTSMDKKALSKAGGGGGGMDSDLATWMLLGLAALVLGVVLVAFYQQWSAARELRNARKLINQVDPRRLRRVSAGPRRR